MHAGSGRRGLDQAEDQVEEFDRFGGGPEGGASPRCGGDVVTDPERSDPNDVKEPLILSLTSET
jgi:hypothetical protein